MKLQACGVKMADDLEWRTDTPPKHGPVLLLMKSIDKKYSAAVSEWEFTENGFFNAAREHLYPVAWAPVPAFPEIPPATIWDMSANGGPAEVLTNAEMADEMISRWPHRYVHNLPLGVRPGQKSGHNRIKLV
jgi:hypothetical protein